MLGKDPYAKWTTEKGGKALDAAEGSAWGLNSLQLQALMDRANSSKLNVQNQGANSPLWFGSKVTPAGSVGSWYRGGGGGGGIPSGGGGSSATSTTGTSSGATTGSSGASTGAKTASNAAKWFKYGQSALGAANSYMSAREQQKLAREASKPKTTTRTPYGNEYIRALVPYILASQQQVFESRMRGYGLNPMPANFDAMQYALLGG